MVTTRRGFLGGAATGLFGLGIGAGLTGRAASAAWVGRRTLDALAFGALEPLVVRIQETAPDALQDFLIDRLKADELDLETIVAATSLANARTFGGEDYIGFHCQMALLPALSMAHRLRGLEAALPVLKVVHRTATRIQEVGGRSDEVLQSVSEPAIDGLADVARLRAAIVARDADEAERVFCALARANPEAAYDALQEVVQDDTDVHRVVLAWRVFETLPVTGHEHATTMMRQFVRFCVYEEDLRVQRGRPEPRLRTLLPELLRENGLDRSVPGTRRASNDELDKLALVVFCSEREDAAVAVTEALAYGWAHEDVAEAICLAANHLLLHDPGRRSGQPGKPKGSVYGASTGVHASDAARAWCNIARVTSRRNRAASLIAGAYHTAGQSGYVGKRPFPYRDFTEQFAGNDQQKLLRRTAAAINEGNQPCAAAAAACYADEGYPAGPLLDLLLDYAVVQEGALHAEKYTATIHEELAAGRPAFHDRHLIALARVIASQQGFEAPGVAAARERLGV